MPPWLWFSHGGKQESAGLHSRHTEPPNPIRASSEIASYTDTTVQSGTKSIFRVHALKNNGVMSELTNPAEITVP